MVQNLSCSNALNQIPDYSREPLQNNTNYSTPSATACHRAHAADQLTNNEGDQLFGSGSVVVCRSEPYKAQTGSA